MKSVYVVTMWSGGRPAKKWKCLEKPEPLNAGTGVEFVNVGTKLKVTVIGSISVEEFESGKEEIEMSRSGWGGEVREDAETRKARKEGDDSNIERLF